MAWRSMIPNQGSTRFSRAAAARVEWMWMRGFAASRSRTSPFVGGLVVHHEVQPGPSAVSGCE